MMAIDDMAVPYSHRLAILLTMLQCAFQNRLGLLTRLIVHEMYNVKIISLEAPFTYEFDHMLCLSCMSYIITLTFGQS